MAKKSFDNSIRDKIREYGVLAVVVVEKIETVGPLMETLMKADVWGLELTLRTPVALDALRIIKKQYPRMLAGIGTVLTPEQVRSIAEEGADFAVAPGTNRRVIEESLKLGLFYVETGANQRPSKVTYDREHSSICLTAKDAFPWKRILADAGWLHITGITPALSKAAAAAVKEAMQEAARAKSVTVSCDLNFRSKLWRWEKGVPAKQLARSVMTDLLPLVDIVIANEQDAEDVLDIQAEDSDAEAGKLSVGRYPTVARRICDAFPNVQRVAFTLRESVSADDNKWGGMLYDAESNRCFFAPEGGGTYAPYRIADIVDRIGGGDSFAAGLIYASTTEELKSPEKTVAFAAAASCLCHSIQGDFNYTTRAEIESLMGGKATGRVIR